MSAQSLLGAPNRVTPNYEYNVMNISTESQSNGGQGPKTWPELLWRFRGLIFASFGILLFSAILALGFAIYNHQSLTNLLQMVANPSCLRSRPIPDPEFALFDAKWPRTETGQPFSVFTDASFNGKSEITLSVLKEDSSAGYFLRIGFALDRGGEQILDAYAGAFAEWSAPPGVVVDLSRYHGVKFRARLATTRGTTAGLKGYVSLAMDTIRDYAYHEYSFSPDLNSCSPGIFCTIKIPFVEFRTPEWCSDQRPFDSRSVFRLSVLIKGSDQSGTLDVDDIKFY